MTDYVDRIMYISTDIVFTHVYIKKLEFLEFK